MFTDIFLPPVATSGRASSPDTLVRGFCFLGTVLGVQLGSGARHWSAPIRIDKLPLTSATHPTLKNKKTNEATEKSAQQKLENQAKKENTDEFLKRVAKAKINNLIPLSLLTEQDCKKKVKGVEEDSVEMYNKALVIALKEAKKNGATPDQIKEVNDKATQDLKIFEGLTTETIISNKGDGPAAVPVHTVAAASSAGKK